MRPVELYARITPRLAHQPGSSAIVRVHARILRRFRGRRAGSLFGAPLLTVVTTGRKSGQPREAPLIYVPHGDAYAVVAANAASTRLPDWWLNLQLDPECVVLVDGDRHAMRARCATPEEANALWPALKQAFPGFRHYLEIADRELPVVLLEQAS